MRYGENQRSRTLVFFEVSLVEEAGTARTGYNLGATVKCLLAFPTRFVTPNGGVWDLAVFLLTMLGRADT